MKLLKSKSARYATSAILVSSLFTACGGGGGGGGTPVAPPTATQAPAATLVSTTPTNNTTKVQAQTSIAMVFSAALDPATVLPSNVLVTGGGVSAPVTVSYNTATLHADAAPAKPAFRRCSIHGRNSGDSRRSRQRNCQLEHQLQDLHYRHAAQ